MLQEQVSVYGTIVIHPKKETLNYDKELVLMLSDWTNENPMSVLKNLKRVNDWYNYRKGTSTPLAQVIKRGTLGAQLKFWKQRMEGINIADIYYPAFLINGEKSRPLQKQFFSLGMNFLIFSSQKLSSAFRF